jgi:uncharacterized protein (DUF3820 family)
MDDNSIMRFGLHKGKKLIDVPASYLIFLYENERCSGDLKQYIFDNLDSLKHDVKNGKWFK